MLGGSFGHGVRIGEYFNFHWKAPCAIREPLLSAISE